MNAFMAYTSILAVLLFAAIGITTLFLPPYPAKIIQDCEKELPRNKHCKIIAVVDENGSEQ
jgi:hypothetical protein